MSTLEEKIAVMQAAERGEKVQCRVLPNGDWGIPSIPVWNWATYEYRVVPKPREFWVRMSHEDREHPICCIERKGLNRPDFEGDGVILVREVTD